MKGQVRFVVNADDFGASDTINSAIVEGVAGGLISSTTLMANGPAFDAACRVQRELANASIGVHLNLTEHRPLTNPVALKPLLDDGGAFRRRGVYEVHWTRSLIEAVEVELTAQVNRVRQAGIDVSHLDSHHHVHSLPRLFFALKRVQRATGIRRVRGTWSIYDRGSRPSRAMLLRKSLWLRALKRVYATRTTDEFSEFVMFLRAVSQGAYNPRRWPMTVELMVHPGHDTADAREEAAALRTGWLEGLPVHASLVTYRTV